MVDQYRLVLIEYKFNCLNKSMRLNIWVAYRLRLRLRHDPVSVEILVKIGSLVEDFKSNRLTLLQDEEALNVLFKVDNRLIWREFFKQTFKASILNKYF